VQLCEGHSALLRLRTVALDAGRAPGAKLWAATWLAFVALRVLPHAALLALLGSAPSALEPHHLYAWGVAVAGLVYLNLSNVASAVHMVRAQTADSAAASIATAVWARPQSSEAPPPTASRLPVDLGPAALAVAAVPGLLLPLTRLQEPACQQLVLGTTLIAGALYALMRFGGLGMPAEGRLSATDAAQWRSRVLSTAHALVLVVGRWASAVLLSATPLRHTSSHPRSCNFSLHLLCIPPCTPHSSCSCFMFMFMFMFMYSCASAPLQPALLLRVALQRGRGVDLRAWPLVAPRHLRLDLRGLLAVGLAVVRVAPLLA
jgi:hypothetical protein